MRLTLFNSRTKLHSVFELESNKSAHKNTFYFNDKKYRIMFDFGNRVNPDCRKTFEINDINNINELIDVVGYSFDEVNTTPQILKDYNEQCREVPFTLMSKVNDNGFLQIEAVFRFGDVFVPFTFLYEIERGDQ